ncbi:hypothetical protein [Kutzneria sp. NPDC052558]|uniref:hypothetical protein n=1 Tax=Kutzneria sp. NPDC052558 TaxID=3364121 RepID=UPI0037C77612
MTDSRRAFLAKAAKITAVAATAAVLPTALAGPASASAHSYYFFCTKCFGMTVGVITPPGGLNICPAGGNHTQAGYNFILPYNVSETANAQANWRLCQKCFSLFWRGYPTDGVCATGGGHDSGPDGDQQSFFHNFVLNHDVPPGPKSQDAWRFCVKCYGLFFFGYSTNGRCPAGNEHKEAGFNFVLDHL